MSVRQDKVQISIAFLTDESKAFAKLVEENKKFINDIKTARKEGKDLTDTIKQMVESGKAISRIPLDKLAPSQLILRAQQLKQVLDLIPKSTPEYKQLEAEYKNINNELATMRQRTKGVAEEMNKARTESSGFFRSLTSFIASATVAFYGLKQVASALFKPSQLASEMEQAMIAFETMLGSARKARKLVNEVIKLAAQTPFEQAELIDYTKRLLAMGIEAKKVIPTITALGDISAGVGKEKLPQIVLAFGQVAAKTKLAGDELKQFTEAGVPLVAQLAEQLGVSEAKIFKIVKAGKIGFKDVEKALFSLTTEGGKFAGLMGKQAQTTEGLLSTLKDNVNIALASFGEGFNIAFKEILRSSTAFTNGLDTQKLKDWGQAVGNIVKFLFEFGPTLLRIISVYAAYRVAVSAAETAQGLFNLSVKFNPIGLFISGLIAVIQLVTSLQSRMASLTETQNDLNQAQIDGAKAAREEMQSAANLFAILREGSSTYEQKNSAVKQLLETYPKYLGDLDTEKELLNNLDEAQKRVNQGIIESAFARIKAAEIQKRAADQIQREIELDQARIERDRLVNQRNNTKQPFATGLNTFDAKTQSSIQAGGADSRLNDILARNKAANDADATFFKGFDTAANRTAESLNKIITPTWTYLNSQIAKTKELLVADPNNEGLKKQLAALEAQVVKEKNGSLDAANAKHKAIEEVDEKAIEKARKKREREEKDALKALKDQYDLLIKQDEIEQQKRLLIFDRAFFNKSITESEHNKRELQTNATHYANLIGILQGYESALVKAGQQGGEEYLNTQKKILEAERKLAELRAELNKPKITELTPLDKRNTEGVKKDDGVQKNIGILEIFSQQDQQAQAERFRGIILGEQQLAIARLEIERNYNDRKIALLEEAGAKEAAAHSAIADQYKELLDRKKNLDDDYLKNKERLKALEEKLEQGKIELLHSAFQAGIDLLSQDEDARKKHASAIKAFQIGEVIVNGISEVQKIWKTYAEFPILAGALTAFAAVRSAAAIGKITKQKFARGGIAQMGIFGGQPHSAGGTKLYGDDGTVIEVEKDELFAVLNKNSTGLLQRLSNLNVAGGGVPYFATGGIVNTTPNINNILPTQTTASVDLSSLVYEFKALRQDVSNWQTRLKAEIYRDEYEAKAAQDVSDRAAATI